MSETWRFGLLGAVVGLALMLGIVTLMRIGELRSDVQRLESLASDVSSLQASLMAAEERIAELEDEQRWVSNEDWTIDADGVPPGCDGDLPVVATWTFQEVDRDADVFVEFRADSESEWARYPAEPGSGVEYSAAASLDPTSQWQYRVVAESDRQVRVSRERDLVELAELVQRSPMIEVGETASENGNTWFRYVVNNGGPRASPCNEIVDAEIQVFDGDTPVETFEMMQEYPGDYLPEGVDAGSPSDDRADDGEAAEDPAAPFFQDAQPNWWSDWIQRDDDVEIFARIEFGDGTELILNERGDY